MSTTKTKVTKKQTRNGPRSVVGGIVDPMAILQPTRADLGYEPMLSNHITHGLLFLTPQDRRLFFADCAARVLSNFERMYPGDTRPRMAIESARAFAQGSINAWALAQSHDAASRADDMAQREARYARESGVTFLDLNLASLAAMSAYYATSDDDGHSRSGYAALTACDFCSNEAEFAAQLTLLASYLKRAIDDAMQDRGDVPALTGTDLEITKATLLRAQTLDTFARLKEEGLPRGNKYAVQVDADIIDYMTMEIAETTDAEAWVSAVVQHRSLSHPMTPLRRLVQLRGQSTDLIWKELRKIDYASRVGNRPSHAKKGKKKSQNTVKRASVQGRWNQREPRFDASALLAQGRVTKKYYDPIDESDVDEDFIYHGKQVRWFGQPGYMIKIPSYLITPMMENRWFPNQIATYADAIDHRDMLEAPAGRIYLVTASTIAESQRAYEEGESELLPFEEADLGEPYAVLLDGNHRAFAAILAGEPYIWVYVGENYREVARPWME